MNLSIILLRGAPSRSQWTRSVPIVIAVVYNVPRKLTAAGVWMTFADNAYVTVTGDDEPVDCNDISFQQCDNHFDPKLPFLSWEDWPNCNQGSSFRIPLEEME